jgi:hypothetical protein
MLQSTDALQASGSEHSPTASIYSDVKFYPDFSGVCGIALPRYGPCYRQGN